jgi:hypothetical protein
MLAIFQRGDIRLPKQPTETMPIDPAAQVVTSTIPVDSFTIQTIRT